MGGFGSEGALFKKKKKPTSRFCDVKRRIIDQGDDGKKYLWVWMDAVAPLEVCDQEGMMLISVLAPRWHTSALIDSSVEGVGWSY